MIIGITGSIASGKTKTLQILKSMGFQTYSCDEIYHDLLRNNLEINKKIISVFGNSVRDRNLKVSRTKLRKILRKSPNKLTVLERITHPFIIKIVKNIVKKERRKKSNLVFIDTPLLFENKLQNIYDKIITVYCSRKIQLQRLKKRDIKVEEIDFLIKRQLPIRKKIKLSNFVILNNTNKKIDLERKIIKVLKKIRKY